MRHLLAELEELDWLGERLGPLARVRTLAQVRVDGRELPINALFFGPNSDANVPVFACFAGVHGVEHIGTEIVLAHLKTLVESLAWDESVRKMVENVRVILVPVVNPSGVLLRRRSNARGVDLMRNAPVDAEERAPPFFLFRGHRLSSRLPWYRGRSGEAMEVESRAICELVRDEMFDAPFALALDLHSGFLGGDRLWFPYAKTRRLIDSIDVIVALKRLLDKTYPNHRYIVEPQSSQYTTHGDLWDYLYDEKRDAKRGGLFLPLTLELGSSSWLRKNPRQVLSFPGFFHPTIPHRVTRTLRRHVPLIEFLMRATYSHENWVPRDSVRRDELFTWARENWSEAGGRG